MFTVKGHRWTLRDFQCMAGWCEWSFNVFPLLKPGLSVLYNKIRGKTNPFGSIHVNNALIRELHWLVDHIERANGLHFFKSIDFDPSSEDVVVAYTDASSEGLGLWFPAENFAAQCPLPWVRPCDTIFFFEALAVCSAIHVLGNMPKPPHAMLIYTDNANTMAMFDSL